MKIKLGAILLILTLLNSCNTKQNREAKYDTNYLPEGVNRIEHKLYEPGHNNFLKARVDPPSWWIGMGMDTIDLLIYQKLIDNSLIRINAEGIDILNIKRLENPNYQIVKIVISDQAKPGNYEFEFTGDEDRVPLTFSLFERQNNTERIRPVDNSDIMYLIMPDRFANGDKSNDSFEDMRQTGIYRDKIYFRHGGDIQGIIDHLDYLEDLGVTALWLNPVNENDMPYSSYHGYAITDHYNVDKRFGTNEKYVELSDSLQARGMKLVMDIVPNHSGTYHFFIQDIPESDWIHQFEEFTRSIHNHPTVRDPYVSKGDFEKHFDGWFDYSMPDLNQKNKDLAKYLIQSYIWWIEYAGLDGFRVDTYQYVDQEFMHEMNKQILKEYPGFHIFAENWTYDRALQAQYVSGSPLQEGFESYLPATADFQWAFSVKEACGEKAVWGEGVQRLHYTMASHYLYEAPEKNVIFLDNHDMDRFYSVVNEDWSAFESGLNLLFTSPGIPCLYYGTELLHKHKASPDGMVRLDMKGGWKEDEINQFDPSNRNELEAKTYNRIKELIKLRKTNDIFIEGEFVHFAPHDFVYSYIWTKPEKCVQVIFNGSDEIKAIDLNRYDEILKDFSSGKIINSTEKVLYPDKIQLTPKQSIVVLWTN